ncbi:MAG: hypothetical protein HOH74_06235 [Gemmatimonadetes bacterium]|nr:hypothetical protein [Gemmatimonadota bacterium]
MAPTHVAVLGGSSPFTAGLVDALLPVADQLGPRTLVLHGRNVEHLRLVDHYARIRLRPYGWQVRSTTDMADAVADARIVIHQIRYGDMEGRAASEAFCARHGCVADETLGPAALLTALLAGPALARTCEVLRAYAADAWILNLTNPLSSITAIMAAGLPRCMGLCELPLVTARQTAHLLGLDLEQVEWHYTGLNHRGFIHRLRGAGGDLLEGLPGRLGDNTVVGVTAQEIADLGALPLKYFGLLRGDMPSASRRGLELMALRSRLYAELAANPGESPPSLRERYMDWYPEALVPVLRALHADRPEPHIVSQLAVDGLVWERTADISRAGVYPHPVTTCNGPVETWLRLFCIHEQAFLHALRAPSFEHVQQALAADPTAGNVPTESLARALWQQYLDQSAAR